MSKQALWIMLGWLLFTQIAVAFVGRSIGPLAPFIESSFTLTKTQIGFLPAALFIGQILASIPVGWYVDEVGTRKMLLILSITLGCAFLIISMVNSYFILLICLIFGGMGYGSMQPTANRGIIYWFPKKLAGTAMGIKQMGVTGGSALSALLLIPLATILSWRITMSMSAFILLVIGLLAFIFYRDPPTQPRDNTDSKESFWPIVKKLFRHKALVIVSVAAMGLAGAQLTLTTYLVFFITDALLYSLVVAGLMLALSEVGGSVGRVIWGIISDRLFHGNREKVLVLISVVSLICSIVTAFLISNISLWILVPLIFIFGFCLAGFNGLWMNIASEVVPKSLAGIASGFSLSFGALGVIIIPPVFGAIVDISGDYTYSWLFISVVILITTIFLLWLQNELGNKGVYK